MGGYSICGNVHSKFFIAFALMKVCSFSAQSFKDINECCERLVELLKGNINSNSIEKWLTADSDAVSVFRERVS